MDEKSPVDRAQSNETERPAGSVQQAAEKRLDTVAHRSPMGDLGASSLTHQREERQSQRLQRHAPSRAGETHPLDINPSPSASGNPQASSDAKSSADPVRLIGSQADFAADAPSNEPIKPSVDQSQGHDLAAGNLTVERTKAPTSSSPSAPTLKPQSDRSDLGTRSATARWTRLRSTKQALLDEPLREASASAKASSGFSQSEPQQEGPKRLEEREEASKVKRHPEQREANDSDAESRATEQYQAATHPAQSEPAAAQQPAAEEAPETPRAIEPVSGRADASEPVAVESQPVDFGRRGEAFVETNSAPLATKSDQGEQQPIGDTASIAVTSDLKERSAQSQVDAIELQSRLSMAFNFYEGLKTEAARSAPGHNQASAAVVNERAVGPDDVASGQSATKVAVGPSAAIDHTTSAGASTTTSVSASLPAQSQDVDYTRPGSLRLQGESGSAPFQSSGHQTETDDSGQGSMEADPSITSAGAESDTAQHRAQSLDMISGLSMGFAFSQKPTEVQAVSELDVPVQSTMEGEQRSETDNVMPPGSGTREQCDAERPFYQPPVDGADRSAVPSDDAVNVVEEREITPSSGINATSVLAEGPPNSTLASQSASDVLYRFNLNAFVGPLDSAEDPADDQMEAQDVAARTPALTSVPTTEHAKEAVPSHGPNEDDILELLRELRELQMQSPLDLDR